MAPPPETHQQGIQVHSHLSKYKLIMLKHSVVIYTLNKMDKDCVYLFMNFLCSQEHTISKLEYYFKKR